MTKSRHGVKSKRHWYLMAIFIASTKSISRGQGQSVVASASYRAGVELEDKRYGKTHDYSKRNGVMSADIILPTSLKNAGATIERGELWNMAESAENRKDARVGREWLVNLPYELSEEDRKELAHTFSQALADRYNVIADCAIHQPTQYEVEKRGADARNFHAHILLTTRQAELSKDNKIILTEKSTAELSDKKRRELGLERMSEEVKNVRQLWERVANEKLAEHGLNLIDCRSYKEQGIDIEPQLKMGSVATKLERDKYQRELRKLEQDPSYQIDKTATTKLGTINQIIHERNELVFNRELRENELINARAEQIIFNSRAQNNDKLRKTIDAATQYVENATTNAAWAHKRAKLVNERVCESEREIERAEQSIERAERAIDDTTRAVKQSDMVITRAAEFDPRALRTSAPKPSPFDTNRRRTIDELAKQQRRNDREIERQARADESIGRAADTLKSQLAAKLLARHDDNCRLRWEWGEKIEDYQDKFDRRQLEILDKFAKEIGHSERKLGYREQLQEIKSLLTDDFINEHKQAIKLLKDPNSERNQYQNFIKDFEDFREHLDSQRNALNVKIKGKIGDVGEISRMTAETLSVYSYLIKLDEYISDTSKHDLARDVAREHKADTLDRTCQQFKIAMSDVHRLSSDVRKTHSNALRQSLDTFIEVYSSELSESAQRAVKEGLRSFNHYSDKSLSRSNDLSR